MGRPLCQTFCWVLDAQDCMYPTGMHQSPSGGVETESQKAGDYFLTLYSWELDANRSFLLLNLCLHAVLLWSSLDTLLRPCYHSECSDERTRPRVLRDLVIITKLVHGAAGPNEVGFKTITQHYAHFSHLPDSLLPPSPLLPSTCSSNLSPWVPNWEK